MNVLSATWMQDLIHTYGLWVLFTAVMLESMGIPMPGEIAVVTAAIYAGSTHQVSIISVVLIAATAAIIGDNIGYLVGRSIGIRLLARYGKYVRLTEQRLKVGEYLFSLHGGKIVFFGRFVALLRTYAGLLAGANRMNWPYFLIMNGLGGICWATLFGSGAYVFGEQISRVAGPLSILLLIAAVCLAVVGVLFYRHHEKELVRRAETEFPGLGCDRSIEHSIFLEFRGRLQVGGQIDRHVR